MSKDEPNPKTAKPSTKNKIVLTGGVKFKGWLEDHIVNGMVFILRNILLILVFAILIIKT